MVLEAQDRRRAQQGDLVSVERHTHGGAHGDLGLAEADVAHDQPIHGLGCREIGEDLVDGGGLVWGLLVGEGLDKLLEARRRTHVRVTLLDLSHGVHLEERVGHRHDPVLHLGLSLLPGLAAELVESGALLADGPVTKELVEAGDWQVHAVTAAVVDLGKLGLLAVQVDALQPLEAPQPVTGVDHEIAHSQLIDAAERGLLEALSWERASLLLAEELVGRDDREPSGLGVEAVIQATDPHAELLRSSELSRLHARGVKPVRAEERLDPLGAGLRVDD